MEVFLPGVGWSRVATVFEDVRSEALSMYEEENRESVVNDE